MVGLEGPVPTPAAQPYSSTPTANEDQASPVATLLDTTPVPSRETRQRIKRRSVLSQHTGRTAAPTRQNYQRPWTAGLPAV